MGLDARVLRSIREYLCYLIESDVEEVHVPKVSEEALVRGLRQSGRPPRRRRGWV